MKAIVHPATGMTYNVEECVIVDLPEELAKTLDGDDYADDVRISEYAKTHGRKINTTDLAWNNSIAYSPSSIRKEIMEVLMESYPSDKDALDWGLSASDAELNEVASYIITADGMWEEFHRNIMEGLREGLRWSKEDGK